MSIPSIRRREWLSTVRDRLGRARPHRRRTRLVVSMYCELNGVAPPDKHDDDAESTRASD
jgi:hypothetical protein